MGRMFLCNIVGLIMWPMLCRDKDRGKRSVGCHCGDLLAVSERGLQVRREFKNWMDWENLKGSAGRGNKMQMGITFLLPGYAGHAGHTSSHFTSSSLASEHASLSRGFLTALFLPLLFVLPFYLWSVFVLLWFLLRVRSFPADSSSSLVGPFHFQRGSGTGGCVALVVGGAQTGVGALRKHDYQLALLWAFSEMEWVFGAGGSRLGNVLQGWGDRRI